MMIRLDGPEGNAFALMSRAVNFGEQLGYSPERIDAMLRKMKSGNYEHLLVLFHSQFGSMVDLYRTADVKYRPCPVEHLRWTAAQLQEAHRKTTETNPSTPKSLEEYRLAIAAYAKAVEEVPDDAEEAREILHATLCFT